MTEQEIRASLGKNIKKYRKQLNLSQEKLAAQINIATNFLSEIETGKKWISPATLAKLTEALDVETYQLFKPENILPAEVTSMLTQYTNTALAKVEKSLTDLHRQYSTLTQKV
jgi:transcriptional regulator with XRE-family HTH domain